MISVGLVNVGRVGSVGVTVSIAFARYMTVCHPTTQFSRKYLLGVIPIAFALLYNIPKFFEISHCSIQETYLTYWHNFKQTKLLSFNETDPNSSTELDTRDKQLIEFLFHPNNTGLLKTLEEAKGTSVMCDPHDHRPSEFTINKWYLVLYKFLSNLLLVEIIPWITVIVLNVFVWKESNRFHQKRRELLTNQGRKNEKCKLQKKSINNEKIGYQ